MSLYLDTCILVPLFIPEAYSEDLSIWIGETGRTLCLSDIAVAEFHAVVSRLVRKRLIDDIRADAIRAKFESWLTASAELVENIPVDIRAAGRLVRIPFPRLLTADATHLATCQRREMTLVTTDRDLQVVAGREGVSWVSPA